MVKGNPLPLMSNHDKALNPPKATSASEGCTDRDTMADDSEQPMTAQDAQIQALQAQMDALKADYDNQLKAYQDANRQLFAMLNPVPTMTEEPAQATPPQGFNVDECATKFYKAYNKQSME